MCFVYISKGVFFVMLVINKWYHTQSIFVTTLLLFLQNLSNLTFYPFHHVVFYYVIMLMYMSICFLHVIRCLVIPADSPQSPDSLDLPVSPDSLESPNLPESSDSSDTPDSPDHQNQQIHHNHQIYQNNHNH